MSNKLAVALVLVVMLGSFILMELSGKRQKIHNVFYRLVIIAIPLSHIGIIFSTFVSVAYVVMASYILYVAMKRLKYGKLAKISGYELALILFIFYVGLTLFWGMEWRETTKQYLGFMLAGCLVLALHQGGLGPSQAKIAKRDMVIIGAIVGFLAILQLTYGEQFYPGFEQLQGDGARVAAISKIDSLRELGTREVRGTGTFINPTACSIFLLAPFCICIDELLKSKRLGYIPFLILIIGGIISTFCRVAYVLAILGVIILCSFYLKRGRILGLLLVIITGLLVIHFLPEQYKLTIINMFSSDSESSIQSNVRYYYWLTALNRLWNAPVLGLGYGGIENIMYGTFQGGNPHSSYISILLNQGAVGLFLLAVLLITSFVALKRALSEDKYTLRPLLVVFLLNLISMMTDTVIYGEMFTCLIPVAFLAIYTSGLRPKSLECSPHFSSRRYPVAAQSSFNYQKPAFADERFQPTTDEACCGFTRSKHG
jgi:hypothetical protein